MAVSLDPVRLKESLKILMKKKNLKYQDLAEHLNVSLPTVKRMMGSEEITLTRLLEICAWLKVTLSDLEILAEMESKKQAPVFNEEQEIFFVKNPEYLSYLLQLYSNDSVEEIATNFKLTPKSTELYLLRLEGLGCLRRDSKGRVNLTHAKWPDFISGGPLMKAYYRDLITKNSDFFLRQALGAFAKMAEKQETAKSDGKYSFTVSSAMHRLSKKTYIELRDKQRDLIREIEQRTSLEERLGTIEEECFYVHTMMEAVLRPGDPEVEGWKNMLGRIVNLEKRPTQE